MDRELSVRKLYLGIQDKKIMDGDTVSMYGWVKSARNNGNVGFIEFNDGTHFKGVQLVFVKEGKCFDDAAKIKYGSSIKFEGKVKLTPNMPQPFEIELESISLVGDCAEDYPLQKKNIVLNF